MILLVSPSCLGLPHSAGITDADTQLGLGVSLFLVPFYTWREVEEAPFRGSGR